MRGVEAFGTNFYPEAREFVASDVAVRSSDTTLPQKHIAFSISHLAQLFPSRSRHTHTHTHTHMQTHKIIYDIRIEIPRSLRKQLTY
jgi:hypothetical protein